MTSYLPFFFCNCFQASSFSLKDLSSRQTLASEHWSPVSMTSRSPLGAHRITVLSPAPYFLKMFWFSLVAATLTQVLRPSFPRSFSLDYSPKKSGVARERPKM